MKPEPLTRKCIWNDENELRDWYCREIAVCVACHGTGQDGEPNGYGCEPMEDFMEGHSHRLSGNLENKEILFKEKDIKSAVEWFINRVDKLNKLELLNKVTVEQEIRKAFEDVLETEKPK